MRTANAMLFCAHVMGTWTTVITQVFISPC